MDLSDLRWMLIPFLACLVLSINHVYLGIHVIARKVIFVDLALAQIAALGATYATTLGYDPYGDSLKVSFFSLIFTFLGAAAFSIARMRKERVPQEAFIGIIYAAASAAAILILSKSATGGEELKHMLTGDLLLVSLKSVIQMAVLYGSIGLFHIILRKKFLAISRDPEEAEAKGINVRFYDLLFYMSFGVVITKSVAIVGVLLVFSYLVVPAVIAQMWSNTIKGRLLLGWVIAILASVGGILWSFRADYPTGPAIVVMLAIFLVISAILYSLIYAKDKVRAAVTVTGLVGIGIAIFFTLSSFAKNTEPKATVQTRATHIDLLLEELKEDEEAHQLDSVTHLAEMEDPRIVPAMVDLLNRTKSEHVIEATINALGKQKDKRAIDGLRAAAEKDYDEFLKITIAKAQLAVGDKQGYMTLIKILKNEESVVLARQQAVEILEADSKIQSGYDPQKIPAENKAGIERLEKWAKTP